MGPKKKEQQIDLNSLPPCTSINAILLARGRKARADAILQKISKDAQKFITKITKNQVLQHAKQKNIYVDPNTLNQKQKKDAKFMESINTQLSPAVIAKAVQSLIATLNVKVRLQKKANQGKEEAKSERKYDMLYWCADFPEEKAQFQELAALQENVKYVLVVDPKVSWANAPEIPQQEPQEEQQPQQEDQEIKQYKQLLKKEEKTQEDLDYQKSIDARIAQIRGFRKQSDVKSQFRNCVISVVDLQIDPYNQEGSLNEMSKLFFENIDRLNVQFADYEEWKKERKTQEILMQEQQKSHHLSRGATPLQLLNDLAASFNEAQPVRQENNESQQIQQFFNDFSLQKQLSKLKIQGKSDQETTFINANQFTGSSADIQSEIRKQLKHPGIDRYLMPQIPLKSAQLRKLHQSHYSLFLKSQDLQSFQRKNAILNFQQYLKQFDQQRAYSFADRIYQEHHDRLSLQRALFKASELHEHTLVTRYDQAGDKLYVALVYKNNPRRVSNKNWQSSWRVIPNYESWLKYFKGNQTNLNNVQYYDIDAEKIGNLEENISSFTLRNGGNGAVLIQKEFTAANRTSSVAYGIKNDLVFGIKSDHFFAVDGKTRIYHSKVENSNQKSYQTIARLANCTLRLTKDGNVTIYKGDKTRLVTPSGYSIVYQKGKSVILHPNGGLTVSSDTYTNPMGYGLKEGHLFRSPTLKRTAGNGQVIKRDDGTVIVNTLKDGQLVSKWIQFYEGSEYQIKEGSIKIQKQGEPFIVCEHGNMKIVDEDLEIKVTSKSDGYQFEIFFKDGAILSILNDKVEIQQKNVQEKITVSIQQGEIRGQFQGESISLKGGQAHYTRKGKTVDAKQQEQKYGQDDTLPQDCIQPRLFVISSDNTGVQLLTETMVNTFQQAHQAQIELVKQLKRKDCMQCHFISKLGKKREKSIRNELEIDLDIFSNVKGEVEKQKNENISLRTLLRYPALSSEDIAEIHRIRTETQSWRKNNIKEENQYGYRPKDQSLLKQKIAAKLYTINQRQKQQVKVDCQQLFNNAVKEYQKNYDLIKKQEEKIERQKQLRMHSYQKRNSVIRQYKRVDIPLRKRKTKQQQQLPQQFLDHYFLTLQGKSALQEMPEWVFKAKQPKEVPELAPQIRDQLNNTNQLNKEEQDHSEENRQRYDTVQVQLSPSKEIYIKPSVFTQRQIDEERDAFESQKKAYKYHQVKRKDFNLYGQQRKNKPQVPTLLRTQPISEINQKYLVTQAPLDKKIKISSMKNKLTSSASNMTEMRKQGPHNLLIKTLDKGNDINKLLQRRTMMVQADLNDKLQRDVLINPVQANFGVIVEGRTYELKIDVKNQDVVSQRISVKRPKSIHVKAAMNAMGPLALGMTRKIIVTIKASSQLLGRFSDEFQIVTKHQIYHIPITAQIITETASRGNSSKMNRGVSEVQENRKKQSSFELPRLK